MKKRLVYLSLVLVMAALTLITGCSQSNAIVSSALTASSLPNPTVNSTSEQTKTQVSQNNGNIQWPSKMPSDVPIFIYGTITGSNNNVMGNIQATFDNVTSDAFNKYQSDLKNADWKITNATQSTDGFEIDATKAKHGVVAMGLISKANGLKVTITYNDHSGQ